MNSHVCHLSVKFTHRHDTPHPSCVQKLCRIIRTFTTISENYPLRQHYFRSTKLVNDEKIRHTKGSHWFTIHPFSSCEYFWHYLFTIVSVLTAFYDQIDSAFLFKYNRFVPGTTEMFLITNIVCFIGMVKSFFTGYVSHKEKINVHFGTGYYKTADTATVLNQKKIALHYLQTFCIPDSICITNILRHFSPIFKDEKTFYMYACIRHIRLVRFYTVKINVKILLSQVRTQQDLMIILECCFWFLYSSMFFGCLLCSIPDITSYAFNEERTSYTSIIHRYYNITDKHELTEYKLFIHATFDAFSMLAIFQTHYVIYTLEIYVIVIFTLIVGNILKVILFLSIFSIFNRKFQSMLKYTSFMREVQNYVRNLNLNKQLSMEVYDYFDVKLKKEYFNEAQIIDTLQRHMQYEIFAQSSMDLLWNCHLFRNLPNYFVIQLSLRLKCETYIPGIYRIRVVAGKSAPLSGNSQQSQKVTRYGNTIFEAPNRWRMNECDIPKDRIGSRYTRSVIVNIFDITPAV